MVPGIEGIGEAVTGGLAARAVEPTAGEGKGHEGACLNCGTPLAGDYCHRCGQAGHVHRTLGAFWHDLAHSVLHLDGKVWRTLPMLAWRPGELTRRYVDGERARFVSPMALFLFSVFLMFAVFSTLGGPFQVNGGDTPAEDRADARRDYVADRAESLTELEGLKAERARLAATGESTTSVDVEIRVVESAIRVQDSLFKDEIARINREEKREAAEEKESGEDSGGKLTIGRTGVGWIDGAISKAEKNPDLLLYKLQNNAYKFSWALIPISVPFLWLLFLHRRRYWQYKAYDHTVFVTYSIAFMSLGLIALSLLRPLGMSDAVVGLAILFVPPLHMYRQLRGAYRLSRWSAIWRAFVLLNFAFIAGGLFLALLLALGVLG